MQPIKKTWNRGLFGKLTFPAHVLQPGETCRVYTNEVHPESGGFSFCCGHAIWKNSGDCGYLYAAAGALQSEYCY